MKWRGIILVFLATLSSACIVDNNRVRAQEVATIEAENYTGYRELGGERIHAVRDPCNGGYLLVGLDWPGEYVSYTATIPPYSFPNLIMRCRGAATISCSLSMTLLPLSGQQSVLSFSATGTGLQCSSWINANGNGIPAPNEASFYLVTLSYVSGGSLQIDRFDIYVGIVGTEPTSWGAIKSLYQ
jgi:hypothetical protein